MMMLAVALMMMGSPAPEEDTTDCTDASMIEGGEVAPCNGALVPRAELWSLIREVDLLRIDIEECDGMRGTENAMHVVNIEEMQRNLDAQIARANALETSLADSLSMHRFQWFEHPAFVATMTALAVGGLAVGVYALALEIQ